ncbi:MAG: hypothetical protein RR623_08550 [Bacilli bacterium]
MAEIIINQNNLQEIINNYKEIDTTFVLRNFFDVNDSKKVCSFFLKGKECKIEVYFKKKNGRTTIIPIGKNIDEANELIDYIITKGLKTNVKPETIVFNCNTSLINDLIIYLETKFIGVIKVNINKNADKEIFKITGYHGDVVTLTHYLKTNKGVIQSLPLFAFNVLITYFSSRDDFLLHDIVKMNCDIAGIESSTDFVLNQISLRMPNSLDYLYPLTKSLSSSFILVNSNLVVEDYSGHLLGVFKTLEGYLRKILVDKYKFVFSSNSFEMFKNNDETNISLLESREDISRSEKDTLNKLYGLYKNKRNPYCHARTRIETTKIITSINEAKDLFNEIVNDIEESFVDLNLK